MPATAGYYGEIAGAGGLTWRALACWVVVAARFPVDDLVMRCSYRTLNPETAQTHDHTLINMNYKDFWDTVYGLREAFAAPARRGC